MMKNEDWLNEPVILGYCFRNYIDDSVQDCSISIALAMELQQYSTKPSTNA